MAKMFPWFLEECQRAGPKQLQRAFGSADNVGLRMRAWSARESLWPVRRVDVELVDFSHERGCLLVPTRRFSLDHEERQGGQ